MHTLVMRRPLPALLAASAVFSLAAAARAEPPSPDLLAKLEAVGVPAGPINNLDQVFDDPHVRHRGLKLDLPSAEATAGSIPGIRTPIMIDGAPMAAPRPAPKLGEHTAEVLREIGEA